MAGTNDAMTGAPRKFDLGLASSSSSDHQCLNQPGSYARSAGLEFLKHMGSDEQRDGFL